MLDYIDSMMIVDKSLNILYTNRFNVRLFKEDAEIVNEYHGYMNKRYFEVYPDLSPEESTMLMCLKTGNVIVREAQTFTDVFGRVYTTNNITYPIIRFGEVVAAMELSQDITSVGDIKNAGKREGGAHKAIVPRTLIAQEASLNSIITNNDEMLENIKKSKIFARNSEPILIYGETGTGKELFVEAMVREDPKRAQKYIAQNCAAIPENLFESLLFGSTKGAFTGAENKIGLFEMANGGVLFLDELNSMPIGLQAKLLRVLQDGKVRPVGSEKEKRVDVKVMVALNKNPIQLIKEGRLREDLFYRLSGCMLYLTPLRDRKEDIPLYIDYYTEQFNDKYGKSVKGMTSNLRSILMKYWWPGNVRELRHVLESMINLAEGESLSTRNLPAYLKELTDAQAGNIAESIDARSGGLQTSLKELLERTEKEAIESALVKCKWNITRAAEMLGVPRQTLKFRMDKLGIER